MTRISSALLNQNSSFNSHQVTNHISKLYISGKRKEYKKQKVAAFTSKRVSWANIQSQNEVY